MARFIEEVDVDKFLVTGKPSAVDSVPVIRGVTIFGRSTKVVDGPTCVAKYAADPATTRTRYFVRANATNRFFDPSTDDKSLLTREGLFGKPFYAYKEVSEQSFNLYTSYLKQGCVNNSLLSNSERL